MKINSEKRSRLVFDELAPGVGEIFLDFSFTPEVSGNSFDGALIRGNAEFENFALDLPPPQ